MSIKLLKFALVVAIVVGLLGSVFAMLELIKRYENYCAPLDFTCGEASGNDCYRCGGNRIFTAQVNADPDYQKSLGWVL